MITIEFGKDRYHVVDEMVNWCRDNLGLGGWVYADPRDWEEGRRWAVSSMFGNATFYFYDSGDASMFVLRWK